MLELCKVQTQLEPIILADNLQVDLGATAINAFDSSNLSSVDITIGAKGTTSANTTGNGGGATLMSGPNIAPFGAVGGNGSSLTPNAIPNAGQAYSISAVTDYSYDNTLLQGLSEVLVQYLLGQTLTLHGTIRTVL